MTTEKMKLVLELEVDTSIWAPGAGPTRMQAIGHLSAFLGHYAGKLKGVTCNQTVMEFDTGKNDVAEMSNILNTDGQRPS